MANLDLQLTSSSQDYSRKPTVNYLRNLIISYFVKNPQFKNQNLATELSLIFFQIKHENISDQQLKQSIDNSNFSDEIKNFLHEFRENYSLEQLRELNAELAATRDDLNFGPQEIENKFLNKYEDLRWQGHVFYRNNFAEFSQTKLSAVSFNGNKMFLFFDHENSMQNIFTISHQNWLAIFNVLCGYSSPNQELPWLDSVANSDFNEHYFLELSPCHDNRRSKFRKRIIDEDLENELKNHIISDSNKIASSRKYQEQPKFISPFDKIVPVILQQLQFAIAQGSREISLPSCQLKSATHIDLICNILNTAFTRLDLHQQFYLQGYADLKRENYYIHAKQNSLPIPLILSEVRKIKGEVRHQFMKRGDFFVKKINDENSRNFYRAFAALYHAQENFNIVSNLVIIDSITFAEFQKNLAGHKYFNKEKGIITDEKDGAHYAIPINQAIAKENEDVIIKYLQDGLDCNLKMSDKNLPLYLAASLGNVNIARLLVNAGAKIDDDNFKIYGSLLCVACEGGHSDFVQFIFDEIKHLRHCKIDINSRNAQGRSALEIAVSLGNLQIIKNLLENNADLANSAQKAVEFNKDAAVKSQMLSLLLQYAQKNNLKQTEEYLLKNGATVNQDNNAQRKIPRSLLVYDGKLL